MDELSKNVTSFLYTLFVQDWVGQRETVIGSQLWWNWEADEARYSGWKQLIQDLSTQHIKVMTYCNPCLAPVFIIVTFIVIVWNCICGQPLQVLVQNYRWIKSQT